MIGVQDGQILPHIQQEENDTAAYIIGLRRSEPRGTAWLEEYLPKTAALIAKHGGKVLIGGNAPQALMALEGRRSPPLRRRLGVPGARARPSLSQRPGLCAAETVALGQHCHGGPCRRARVSTSRHGRCASVLRPAVGCPPGMMSLLLHTTRDGRSQRMRVPRLLPQCGGVSSRTLRMELLRSTGQVRARLSLDRIECLLASARLFCILHD
jgi:hypothetical protein